MDIDFIGMPLMAGASVSGMDQAPAYVRQIGLETLFTHHVLCDIGDVRCDNNSMSTNSQMKHLTSVLRSCEHLHNQVVESLKANHFPLVFGGDHSLSWGSIGGVAEVFKELGIIYIDAHGDFNTKETSITHNVHGMHMAYLMGLGHMDVNDIKDVQYSENCVCHQNVFFVGSRALDDGELLFAKEKKLNIYSSQDIIRQGASKVASSIISSVRKKGIKHVHISFDVDVIDPFIFPGTGVPEKDGINLVDVESLLSMFLTELPICSMDFVEFNPLLDKNNKSLSCCVDLLHVIDDKLV